MIGNQTKTKASRPSVWASIAKTLQLRQPDHTRDDRTHEKLRSPRVDTPVQREDIEAWLKRSSSMVDRSIVGLAQNQRRVRYFGFETTHESAK